MLQFKHLMSRTSFRAYLDHVIQEIRTAYGDSTPPEALQRIATHVRQWHTPFYDQAAQAAVSALAAGPLEQQTVRLSLTTILNGKGIQAQAEAEVLQNRSLIASTPWVSWNEVEMPDNAVFVMIVSYPLPEHSSSCDKNSEVAIDEPEPRFIAWTVARNRGSDQFEIIDYGPDGTRTIIEIVGVLKNGIEEAERLARSDDPQDHRRLFSQQFEEGYSDIMHHFKQSVLDPIEAKTGLYSTEHWLISPAASLWLVPFGAARVSGNTSYATETFRIRYLLNGRDSLIQSAGSAAATLIMSNPDVGPPRPVSQNTMTRMYSGATSGTSLVSVAATTHLHNHLVDEQVKAALQQNISPVLHSTPLPTHQFASLRQTCRFPRIHFRRCRPAGWPVIICLPPQKMIHKPVLLGTPSTLGPDECPLGTFETLSGEAASALNSLSVAILNAREPGTRLQTGIDASEDVFLGATSPRARSPREVWFLSHGFFLGCNQDCVSQESSSDPLLNCGLATANANTVRRISGRAASDGIILGREIAARNLRQTELVVLVACQGGVGPVDGGSLATLRHSFLLAGARSVIATSWSVTANEASGLMRRFLFERTRTSPDIALSEAQRFLIMQLRRGPSISTHPYFWASFTFTGSWAQ